MAALREKISAAAQELYLRGGVEGVSMRKVAERAGVSAPAIYRHFKSKAALLNEIVAAGLRILEGYLRPALEAPTPSERLRRLIDRYLAFTIEQPRYFDFAFLIPSRNIGQFSEEIAKGNWLTFRLAVDQVRACMEQGLFRKDDPLATAIAIWAEVHGLVTLYRTGRFGLDEQVFREIYRTSVERVLRGLAVDAQPS
jgi:AcrR family transcriptional regulator